MRYILSKSDFILEKLIFQGNAELAYNKYYKDKMPENVFVEIIEADPTSSVAPVEGNREDTNVKRIGKYSKWLLDLYLNKKLLLEDLYKATEYLETFDKFKGRLAEKDRNINIYPNLPKLFLKIEDFIPDEDSDMDEELMSNKELKDYIRANETRTIVNDDYYHILVTLTHRANQIYGSHTRWCTTQRNGYQFNHYSSESPLYVVIDKETTEKYQISFTAAQFMDYSDSTADCSVIRSVFKYHDFFKADLKAHSKGLISDLKNIDGKFYFQVSEWTDMAQYFDKDGNVRNDYYKDALAGDNENYVTAEYTYWNDRYISEENRNKVIQAFRAANFDFDNWSDLESFIDNMWKKDSDYIYDAEWVEEYEDLFIDDSKMGDSISSLIEDGGLISKLKSVFVQFESDAIRDAEYSAATKPFINVMGKPEWIDDKLSWEVNTNNIIDNMFTCSYFQESREEQEIPVLLNGGELYEMSIPYNGFSYHDLSEDACKKLMDDCFEENF